MKLRAKVDEKGFRFSGRRDWVVSRLKELSPGDWDVEFKPHVKQTTDPQRKYYWAVMVEEVYHGLRKAGFNEIHDRTDAHDVLKSIFFKRTMHSDTHDDIVTTVSTQKFSAEEMSEKFEEIWQWAYDYLGIRIPPPNSQSALDFPEDEKNTFGE